MACVLETCDPNTYVDAQGLPGRENAMFFEIESLQKIQTWDLVPQPHGKNVVKYQWVYKTNFTSEFIVECHNPLLVARGFSQK